MPFDRMTGHRRRWARLRHGRPFSRSRSISSLLPDFPNDAFMPILGSKPDVLGPPFSDVWHKVWPALTPIVDKAFAGEATYIEDFPLVIDRHGYPEATHFTFCYSPIRDEAGHVVGMLDTVTETTEKVRLYEQRQVFPANWGIGSRTC